MDEKGVITLYLAGWQKRMISDYIPDIKLIHKIRFSVAEKKPILLYKQLVMYRQPVEIGGPQSWNLYLTDEQITHVMEVTGGKLKFSAINITPELLKSKDVVFE